MTMAEGCQVDFYVLQDESQSAEKLACRLALMAWEQGNRSQMLAEDDAEAERLDKLMWEYPPGRFLPHARVEHEPSAPVVIATGQLTGAGSPEVVINLTRSAIPDPENFRRLLEVVPASAAQRQASRDKFRAYRDQGLEPAHHPIKHG